MNETPWERLHRIAEARRSQLGLGRHALQERGGPSSEWVRGLKERTGDPTPRMRTKLDDLDRALQWRVGTSWGLLKDDRSGWSQTSLSAEDYELVQGAGDPSSEAELSHFETLVLAALRNMPPERRGAVMAEVAKLLGFAIAEFPS